MTTENITSLFDRLHATHAIVKISADQLDALADPKVAHVVAALGVAVEQLDKLVDDAMVAERSLTKPKWAARAAS